MVVKKIIGSFEILITKTFKRKKKKKKKKKKRKRHLITIDSRKPQSSPSPSPSSQALAMSSHHHPKSAPFLFPFAESTVLPDPTPFFPPSLLSSPLPTNSFFQNFVLKNGDQPEYIHPYLIKSSSSTLSLSYPSLFSSSVFLYQAFVPDLTISTSRADTGPCHLISSFDDLSVTLELPSSSLKFFLVRGSPYLTFAASDDTPISITTIHAILSFSASDSRTKYTIKLNNGQTWLLYSSSAIRLSHDLSSITCDGFSGIIRIAVLPEPDSGHESILDRFVSCYPLSGAAAFTWPHCLEYVFEKRGWGSLLMLAHPLHLNLLSPDDGGCFEVLDSFKYKSIDGDLVGVVGDSWMLKPRSVPVTWHSIKGVDEEAIPEIISSLSRDVHGLDSASISTQSSYFYGKLVARAARLALIAEEVCHLEVIPVIRMYLKETIEPWLNGDFQGNGFLYESKWGGIVTKQGLSDYGADFGFGVYNDHHYHLGYFLYGIAVLAKIDPAWGRKHKPQAYSLMADFMTVGKKPSSNYPRLRNFDLWKLHSWAGGLTEFADGRNQESTSEAINAYYSAALMGLAYGDSHLVATGSMLASLEIQAAQTWWHIRDTDTMYGPDFTRENKVVGVLWANKRDSGLWFAPPDWKECRLGIQLLPLLPISEVLFSDVGFLRQLVNWTLPALQREGVGEGWKGFVYALEGVYDKERALEKIRGLNAHDDGNTLTNLLWWVHSRGVGGTGHHESGCQFGWFSHYCD